MKWHKIRNAWLGAVLLAACCLATTLCAQTRTLRIVTYNIEDDINGATTPLPGLIAPPGNPANVQAGGVLEGIGEEVVGPDPAQPLDVLALEETTSNPITVAPIVNGLNSFYGVAGMYSNSAYQATESGGDTADGNGPNAIVFNTKTVQLLVSVPVDPPTGTNQLGSASGEYREVMRYEFAPAGVATNAANVFYLYVSHYKSGTTATDVKDRLGEAQIIRNDEANNLPAAARVLYVGDYNVDNSGEPMYETILSNTALNGVQQGQGIDPLNPTNNPNLNWSASTTDTNLLVMLTEHSYELEYRDDLQVMTTNVYYGTAGGLKFVPGTYHAFGNNGTTAYYGSVNNGADTALNYRLVTNAPVFISAAQLYLDLTNASDHLPVVADYTIPLPAPVLSSFRLDRDESGPQCGQQRHRRNFYRADGHQYLVAADQLVGAGDQCFQQRQLHAHRQQRRESRCLQTILSPAGKVSGFLLTDVTTSDCSQKSLPPTSSTVVANNAHPGLGSTRCQNSAFRRGYLRH